MNLILTVSSAFGEKLAECLFGLMVTGVLVLAVNFLNQGRPESESKSERPRCNRHEELGDDADSDDHYHGRDAWDHSLRSQKEDEDSHDHHHGHDGHDGDGE